MRERSNSTSSIRKRRIRRKMVELTQTGLHIKLKIDLWNIFQWILLWFFLQIIIVFAIFMKMYREEGLPEAILGSYIGEKVQINSRWYGLGSRK